MSKMLPMLDPFDEIKRLYFSTTAQTIERDMARALDLLTQCPTTRRGTAWRDTCTAWQNCGGSGRERCRVQRVRQVDQVGAGRAGPTGPTGPKKPKR